MKAYYSPVKFGLNPYRYCDNDPVDYMDSTGRILNIIGATQASLLATGAGVPASLLANFTAGLTGSTAKQYISDRRVDIRKSITNGLTNAVSNAIYRNNPLNSAKEAFGRGFGAGAATAGINYISEHIGRKPSQGRMVNGIPSAIPAIIGDIISPYGLLRDPKRGCGSTSPFTPRLGYSSARGYQYDIPRTRESRNQNGFSLKDFLKETLLGGLTGGLTSAAFYGAGKGIEKLKASVLPKKGGSDTTRVGKWMSQEEYSKMLETGQVQMSGDHKVHVANPANIDAFQKQAPKGSVYVEFDVPSNAISAGGKDGWGIINGPGSMEDRYRARKSLPRITEMPKAINIEIKGSK